MLGLEKFKHAVSRHKTAFDGARPYPHIALDDLWPDEHLRSVVAEFPDVWGDSRNDVGIQVKKRTNWQSEDDVGPATLELIQTLNSGKFLRLLSKLTEIEGLIPDPYLTGGGLNLSERGGQLAIHVDGTYHDYMRLHRRVNVIVYLNEEWREEWGGHYEAWEADEHAHRPGHRVTNIAPKWNRTVIFPTNDFTWHGHPHPLACPEGMGRKSLILYYYTAERPAWERWHGDTDNHHRAVFVPT